MEGGFVMENRLFLLYFPGYYDGDEIIGIYDDISKLKASYERVISNPADEQSLIRNLFMGRDRSFSLLQQMNGIMMPTSGLEYM